MSNGLEYRGLGEGCQVVFATFNPHPISPILGEEPIIHWVCEYTSNVIRPANSSSSAAGEARSDHGFWELSPALRRLYG